MEICPFSALFFELFPSIPFSTMRPLEKAHGSNNT
jgi:hypothetical protein